LLKQSASTFYHFPNYKLAISHLLPTPKEGIMPLSVSVCPSNC